MYNAASKRHADPSGLNLSPAKEGAETTVNELLWVSHIASNNFLLHFGISGTDLVDLVTVVNMATRKY